MFFTNLQVPCGQSLCPVLSWAPIRQCPPLCSVYTIYHSKGFINAWLSPHIWELTSKLGGWMSSTCSILCLSPCPFASLSGQPPASSCGEVQRTVVLPLYSFCLPKLPCEIGTLNLKTVLYYTDTNKHSHSVFFLLFLPYWHCQDRWFAFPLNRISLRQLWKSFLIVCSLDDHFASFLFIVWFVPFLKLSDLWKSTSIHEEFSTLVNLDLKL